MELKQLQKIKKEYGFDSVEFVKEFETRGERVSFLFKGDGALFVYKEIENTSENMQRINFLAELGPKSNFIQIKGSKSGSFFGEDGFIYFVYSFVEGKEGRPSVEYFHALGKSLSKLHTLTPADELPEINPQNLLSEIKGSIEAEGSKFRGELLGYLGGIEFKKVKKSVIHGDPSFYNSIITTDDEIRFIDFDTLSNSSSLLEVAFVIVYMTHLVKYDFPKLDLGEIDSEVVFYPEWLEAFLAGYGKGDIDFEEFWNYVMLQSMMNIYQSAANDFFEINYKRLKEVLRNKNKIEGFFKP